MTATYQSFVTLLPEFKHTALYPTEQVQEWLNFANTTFSWRRLGDQFDVAVMMFTAHNLVLSAQAASRPGGNAGSVSGPLVSKSVGALSASYDVEAIITKGAGIYNATTYGMRLLAILKVAAVGGFYVAPRRLGGPNWSGGRFFGR